MDAIITKFSFIYPKKNMPVSENDNGLTEQNLFKFSTQMHFQTLAFK